MTQTLKLWSGTPISTETIPLINCVTHVIVHRAKKRHYQFLLGADIIDHNGVLFCGWGNSKVQENDSGSIMAGRRSHDNGFSWKEFEIIAPGSKGKDAHSHGVFFKCKDQLYAFVPRAEYDYHSLGYSNLRTELFVLDKHINQWQSEGIVISEQPFWPMSRPLPLDNGNYIMPGIVCINMKALPVVAISQGEDIKQWRIIQIPTPNRKDTWAEGGLIISGNEILYIFRNGWSHSQRAQVASSSDYGETWTSSTNTNIPMSTSKPCCGMLSTGQRYLIFNPTGCGRDSLAIAVSNPEEQQFHKIWRIRHGSAPMARTKGSAKFPQWAYPLAHEYNGNLYVVYAATKEDCVLSIIPLEALT